MSLDLPRMVSRNRLSLLTISSYLSIHTKGIGQRAFPPSRYATNGILEDGPLPSSAM